MSKGRALFLGPDGALDKMGILLGDSKMISCSSNTEYGTGIVCDAEIEVCVGVGLSDGKREVLEISVHTDGEKRLRCEISWET